MIGGSMPRSKTDSLERRHEGRSFIQHGQNLVSRLGRKHQDDPINAGVTVAFQHLQVSGRPEDFEGERREIAAGVLCVLSELRQHLERIQRTPADRNPAIAIGDRPCCCVGKCAPNHEERVKFLNRIARRAHG